MPMTIKEAPSMTLLCVECRVTMRQIPALAEEVIDALHETARVGPMPVLGPLEFHYHGADGMPTTKFTILIGLPVRSAEGKLGPYQRKAIGAFKCAALDYHGPMTRIGQAFEELSEQVRAANLQRTDECREVYKHWVAYDSEENITELQVGVMGKEKSSL